MNESNDTEPTPEAKPKRRRNLRNLRRPLQPITLTNRESRRKAMRAMTKKKGTQSPRRVGARWVTQLPFSHPARKLNTEAKAKHRSKVAAARKMRRSNR